MEDMLVSVISITYNQDLYIAEAVTGNGGLFPTNSMVFRKPSNGYFPDFYPEDLTGDYPLTIYSSLQGLISYLNENMSAYRMNIKGSGTQRTLNDNSRKLNLLLRIEVMLQNIDEYSNYKYTDVINNKIIENRFSIEMLVGNYIVLKKGDSQDIYERLNFFEKIKLNIRMGVPKLYVYIQNVRKGLNI